MISLATKALFERACPVCGSNSHIHFADEQIDKDKISEYTYASRKQPEFMCLHLVRCTDCDLVYAPTPPSSEELLTAYSEAAFDSSIEALAAAHSYAKALDPYLGSCAGRNAAVDVGAGSGPLLPWLCEKGFRTVIGIEPSRAAIDAAPLPIRSMLREGMFSKALLEDATPSLICSFMTLEHLSDPGEFVKSAYNLLEPNGMLAIVVHNWRSPINRLLGLRSPIIDVEHLQLFSQHSIRTLFNKVGFVSIDLKQISNTYQLRYWLRLTPLPICLKSRIIDAFEYIGLSDWQVSLCVGNMLVVGIKPVVEKK